MNKSKMPVEVSGYRNVCLPTYDPERKCVVDKWWSLCSNDNYADDEILPSDEDEGSGFRQI